MNSEGMTGQGGCPHNWILRQNGEFGICILGYKKTKAKRSQRRG
jgi:hypothetical protein